ncbi:MAG: hypothetical protein JEZ03_06655 [Bacteroidales bacterium]|nr:hypothetical protein [Bacteroidales bacterium]
MQESQKLFMRQHLVFSAFIAAFTALVFVFAPQQYISPALPYIFLFYFIVSGLILNFLSKSIGDGARKFTPRFLGTVTFKLLFYLMVMVIYALLNKEDAIPFILAFAVYYLLYTVFDIMLVLKHLNNLENKG